MGHGLYVQACNPSCDFRFLHVTLRVARVEGLQRTRILAKQDDLQEIEVSVGGADDPDAMTHEVFSEIRTHVAMFALMKNLGRRLLDVEDTTRAELRSLLSAYQVSSEMKAKPLFRTIADRWRTRGWRRQARATAGRLWLGLASLDSIQRIWSERRYSFESVAEKSEWGSALFGRDLDELPAIQSLDLEILRSGVEHASKRLDNREVVLATALGAVGGAVAGSTLVSILS